MQEVINKIAVVINIVSTFISISDERHLVGGRYVEMCYCECGLEEDLPNRRGE